MICWIGLEYYLWNDEDELVMSNSPVLGIEPRPSWNTESDVRVINTA